MHRYALAARDEAAHRVRRHRLAALGELGHQPVHADNQHAAVAGVFGFSFLNGCCNNFWRKPLRFAQRPLQLPQVDLVARHRRKQFLSLRKTEFVRELLQVRLQRALAPLLLFHGGTSLRDGLRVRLRVEPLAHLAARAVALQETERRVEPVAGGTNPWPARLRGDNLHALAALQGRVERHHLAVHLRAAAAVAEVGVQRVGEIHRRRTRRQVDDLTLRGDDVQRVVERGLLRLLRPAGAARTIGDFVAPGEQLAQPGDFVVERTLAARGLLRFLVAPVRGNAEFRLPVHFLGADLYFQRAPARPDHRGVQRLVVVALGPRDVVVELLGDRLPQVVHHAERAVAVGGRGHDHAQRAHIVDLLEVEALRAHLVPDGVDVLRSAGDFSFQIKFL